MAKPPDYTKPDHYARKAKEQGYGARSVFKLEEVDEKDHLLRPGMTVLDLGASPGSWAQYASERVGPKGLVVSVDLKPLSRPARPNEVFILGDAFELDPASLPVPRFDLVLSDMMPNTIGHKSADHYRSMAIAERALWLCDRLLKPGGAFLVKVFQGADFEQYRNLMRERFRVVKLKKPKSSRPNSREMFMLGLDKKKEEIHAEEKTDWQP